MATARASHQRWLVDHLRTWTSEQIATLLVRRPDLSLPHPPTSIGELSGRAQAYPSIQAAIGRTTLAENRLLQLLVCCPADATLDTVAQALPPGVTLGDIEPTFASLDAAALTWRLEGRVHLPTLLRSAMPTPFGPPLRQLVGEMPISYLHLAVDLLRAGLSGATLPDGVELPPAPRPRGVDVDLDDQDDDNEEYRGARITAELESLLVTPGVVAAVLASGPAEAAKLSTDMAEGRPLLVVDHPLYFSHDGAYSRYYDDKATYWLFERALLLPTPEPHVGVQAREVGVSLRDGSPVADLAVHEPPLVVGRADPRTVDDDAATRASTTLDRLADILDAWDATPAKALKTGGLGATAMKQIGAMTETEAVDAACLVELLHLGGLIQQRGEARVERRQNTFERFVEPSAAASRWLDEPAARRWRRLAEAWLRAAHWPSANGRKDPDGKTVAVLTAQFANDAVARRRDVLDALLTLDPPAATSAAAVAAHLYWHRPQIWMNTTVTDPAIAVEWIWTEAEALGLVAHGRLSTFGRALVSGRPDDAEAALAMGLPPVVTTFTLQADLTAVVVGGLERKVLGDLRLLADIESRGAASTYRFTESSLRRAFDEAWSEADIIGFLDAHATKGVPQALSYLVGDVGRRHGHLLVGTAACFVTSEDPAILADACSHRRTKKLGLRLLAPTVATCTVAPAKVIAGLREAGFLPATDPDDVAVTRPDPSVVIIRPSSQPTGLLADDHDLDPVDDRAAVDGDDDGDALDDPFELPEPFATRARTPRRVPIDDTTALAAAQRITEKQRSIDA